MNGLIQKVDMGVWRSLYVFWHALWSATEIFANISRNTMNAAWEMVEPSAGSD